MTRRKFDSIDRLLEHVADGQEKEQTDLAFKIGSVIRTNLPVRYHFTLLISRAGGGPEDPVSVACSDPRAIDFPGMLREMATSFEGRNILDDDEKGN